MTTAEQGGAFLKALANSNLNTLKEIDFSGGIQVIVETNDRKNLNNRWFNGQ